MPTIDLPHATISYRLAGPDDPAAPTVVFVHGFLVDGELWRDVADALARQGVRSFAPTWPLGAHTTPLGEGADRTPRGMARLVLAFLEALDLRDVTLVANDSGGAITQMALDEVIDGAAAGERIGRVVFTNADAFETFPPQPFATLFKPARWPLGALLLLTPMRLRPLRHSPLGFGLLLRRPDADLTRSWITPALGDAAIRRDAAAFVAGVDPQELLEVGGRLRGFTRPVLLVWGAADRCFTLALGRRLRDAFPDAELIEVPGARTFVSLDEPEIVARHVAAFARRSPAPAAAAMPEASPPAGARS